MTEPADIAARLRAEAATSSLSWLRQIFTEAADEIEALRAEADMRREDISQQSRGLAELAKALDVAERERDEARAHIDLLGGAQENLQKQIIELRRKRDHT